MTKIGADQAKPTIYTNLQNGLPVDCLTPAVLAQEPPVDESRVAACDHFYFVQGQFSLFVLGLMNEFIVYVSFLITKGFSSNSITV